MRSFDIYPHDLKTKEEFEQFIELATEDYRHLYVSMNMLTSRIEFLKRDAELFEDLIGTEKEWLYHLVKKHLNLEEYRETEGNKKTTACSFGFEF